MKTLVISDIHLGSPLSNKNKELITLLKSSIYDTIVLNGDIFDIWEDSLDYIVLNNIKLIHTLQEESIVKNIYYVIGNHDPDAYEIKKLFPYINVVDNLKIDDILFIHGHEFDDLVTKYSWFAKILFVPHWLISRIFYVNIKSYFRKLFNSISNKKNKSYYKELVGDIEEEAILKYKEQCRYLVMGHTHIPKIVEDETCTYINCGDIIHNNVCVEIDENKNFKFKSV